MMLFLDWLFEDRDITWLTWLERPLARIGKLDQLSVIIALAALTGAASAFADEEHFGQVMISGVLGVVTYLLVNGLGNLFEGQGDDEDDEEEVGALESAKPAAAAAEAPGRAGPEPGRAGHRQGRSVPVPLPRGPGRVVLLRRRDRRVRDHPGHLHHHDRPRRRRVLDPVAHGVPRAPGHPGRVRLPRARRALGHRRPGRDPAGHHQVRDQRDRHRPHRRGVHRDLVRELDPAQPPARPREPLARAPARHV